MLTRECPKSGNLSRNNSWQGPLTGDANDNSAAEARAVSFRFRGGNTNERRERDGVRLDFNNAGLPDGFGKSDTVGHGT